MPLLFGIVLYCRLWCRTSIDGLAHPPSLIIFFLTFVVLRVFTSLLRTIEPLQKDLPAEFA
jgi:hypothetical protein